METCFFFQKECLAACRDKERSVSRYVCKQSVATKRLATGLITHSMVLSRQAYLKASMANRIGRVFLTWFFFLSLIVSFFYGRVFLAESFLQHFSSTVGLHTFERKLLFTMPLAFNIFQKKKNVASICFFLFPYCPYVCEHFEICRYLYCICSVIFFLVT